MPVTNDDDGVAFHANSLTIFIFYILPLHLCEQNLKEIFLIVLRPTQARWA